jgi:carboxypeptidase C (cathepsin A)
VLIESHSLLQLLHLVLDVRHYIVIYIDQPIGAGFSFGNDTVNSTQSAAPFVWQAFQVLFESQTFHKYSARE